MATKYLVKFQNWDDPLNIENVSENKTYNAARKSLDKRLKENGYLLTDDKWSQTYIRAGFIPGVLTHIYWIEDEKGNELPLNYKVSAKTINNQQLTLFTNQQKTTFMPTAKVKIGTKKNGQPVYGTANVSSIYKPKGTKNGKPAMTVPAQYVTLPANFYIFGRKHNGNGNNRRTYVIGATKTKNGKNLYCVAQLTYMGGKPAVAENRYKGYSRYNAWSTFNEIPYTDKEVKDAKNNWKKSTSDGSAKAAVNEAISIRRRFAANRAKK